MLTGWIIDELREVVSRKRADLLPVLDALLSSIDYEMAEPGQPEHGGPMIADDDDQPILDAALAADVDAIVTGDKHFLALNLSWPQMLTPRAFLDSWGLGAAQEPFGVARGEERGIRSKTPERSLS